MVRTIFLLVITAWVSSASAADKLFEGYAKVIINGKHAGYVVSRYEFDAKKNQFLATTFLKTGNGTNELTESLKAVANADLAPISYEYTSVIGKETKTIDAKFKKDTMIATVKTNGRISRIEKKIPKGTFLSSFLVYLMLKSKEGLKSESKYEYQAIAEEDAAIYKGLALVGKEESFNGFKAFKILNTFKDSKFLSYVNDRGEVLGTNVMSQGVSTELTANAKDATQDMPLSSSLLTAIFGNVPKGDSNVVARAVAASLSDSAPKSPNKDNAPQGKFEGTPGGQGIQIKPEGK